MKRKLVIAATIAFALLALIVTRAVWEGRSQLARGDEAVEAGDTAKAMRHWRRAARWYVPLAPHVTSAYARLIELAKTAEAAGHVEDALVAWRAVRGSVMATRSFYTPHDDHLALANRHIADLMAKSELSSGVAPKAGTAEERATFHFELLTRPEAPSVFWSIVALLGFGIWVGAAVWFCRRGIDADDNLVGNVAARSGASIAVGLVVWLLGLHLA